MPESHAGVGSQIRNIVDKHAHKQGRVEYKRNQRVPTNPKCRSGCKTESSREHTKPELSHLLDRKHKKTRETTRVNK
jgi:hypothetical protein